MHASLYNIQSGQSIQAAHSCKASLILQPLELTYGGGRGGGSYLSGWGCLHCPDPSRSLSFQALPCPLTTWPPYLSFTLSLFKYLTFNLSPYLPFYLNIYIIYVSQYIPIHITLFRSTRLFERLLAVWKPFGCLRLVFSCLRSSKAFQKASKMFGRLYSLFEMILNCLRSSNAVRNVLFL